MGLVEKNMFCLATTGASGHPGEESSTINVRKQIMPPCLRYKGLVTGQLKIKEKIVIEGIFRKPDATISLLPSVSLKKVKDCS